MTPCTFPSALNKMKKYILRCFAALVLGAASGQAADPFTATTVTTDNLPQVVLSSSESNFFDFFDSILNARGPFQALTGRAYNGNMAFLGVQNAIQFDSNTAGTAVNITLAPIGFNRTFTGASRQAVDDAVEDFFKSDGAQVIADFLREIAKT